VTNLGHRLTGIGAGGVAAGVVLVQLQNPVYAMAAGVVGFAGSTAPDWLELAWTSPFGVRYSLIPHRTWTHWLLPWLLLFAFSLLHPALSHSISGAMLSAFCIGGLTHLLMDWPNPMGIPVLHPTRRSSLRLWASGKNELVLVLVTWVVGAMSIVVAI
jgi:inner membrane protein